MNRLCRPHVSLIYTDLSLLFMINVRNLDDQSQATLFFIFNINALYVSLVVEEIK
jgi:hypothetical protein